MLTSQREAEALEAAEKVFCWYFIFGEDSYTARSLLLNLGNKLRDSGYLKSFQLPKKANLAIIEKIIEKENNQ